MKSTALFSKTPPLKLFFLASLPGAVSMLASALYQTIDGIFVGQFLGATAFAALNLAMPFVIINFSLADLIGVGSAVPISICLGKKAGSHNIFTCACLMIVGTSVAVGGILFAAAQCSCSSWEPKGEFARLSVQYLQVYALCSPVTTIIFAVDNYLRICGHIRGSMFLNILMSALSAGLEFLFLGFSAGGSGVRPWQPAPGMMVCAVIAFIPFFRSKRRCSGSAGRAFRTDDPADCRLRKPELFKQHCRQGHVHHYERHSGASGGETAVSVYGVLMFAEGFIQPLLYGMCDSLQPAVGYNWGRAKFPGCGPLKNAVLRQAALFPFWRRLSLPCFRGRLRRCLCRRPGRRFSPFPSRRSSFSALPILPGGFPLPRKSYMLAIEKPLPASLISVSTALVFPVLLIRAFWPLGLTGIWLNFAGTSVLAAVLSLVILKTFPICGFL